MTHLDLFSGIGGFALAARWAGIETVQFVEIDKFCQKVLAKNFPGVPIHDDITTYRWVSSVSESKGLIGREREQGIDAEPNKGRDDIPGGCNGAIGGQFNGEHQARQARPFLLTGGFPCQPFSCAGKRQGKEDDRYLWPEMLRVVSEAKPTYVIGENVAGFINMGLDDCISDLENQGYGVQTFIIPACAVNAPHRRDRVWIVANSVGGRAEQGHANPREPFTINRGGDRDAPHAQSGETQPAEPGGLHAEPCGKAGWNEPWPEVAARLCRVDDGIPRQVDRVNRLKALGNAIVPQVAYEIIKAIREGEE